MKLLKVFDYKNYNNSGLRSFRKAARAIIIKDDKIALVKSNKEGFYKFPGGGILSNESIEDALIRETMEEIGLIIKKDSIKEYGIVQEIRRDLYNSNNIFDHTSYYYIADVEDKILDQHLDSYEKDLQYELQWVNIEEAYQTNNQYNIKNKSSLIYRENFILNSLKK